MKAQQRSGGSVVARRGLGSVAVELGLLAVEQGPVCPAQQRQGRQQHPSDPGCAGRRRWNGLARSQEVHVPTGGWLRLSRSSSVLICVNWGSYALGNASYLPTKHATLP